MIRRPPRSTLDRSSAASDVYKRQALDFIDAFAIGIDFTLRDIQNNAKKEGNPWSISKGFFGSATVGSFIDKIDIQDYNNLKISLKLNGELKQFGYTKDMIFKIPFIVSYLSNIFTCLLYTSPSPRDRTRSRMPSSA